MLPATPSPLWVSICFDAGDSLLTFFWKGPFTTKVTSKYLLITQIDCIPHTSGFTRRHALPEATPEPEPQPTALYIRGAKPQTFTPKVKKSVLVPKLAERLRRQAPLNPTTDSSMLTGEAYRLIEQLFTVIYSIGVINSGTDLGPTCRRLQSANAMIDLDRVGLNATQAASIVCAASLPNANLTSWNQTLIARAAEGLFSVQLAANFTGTVETNRLCNQLELSSLPGLGVDADAVKSFVCNAKNGTISTTGTDNATSTTTLATNTSTFTGSDVLSAPTMAPSAGNTIPFPSFNSSEGTLTVAETITVTSLAGTAVTAPRGTSFPASGTGFFPTGNLTAATRSIGSGTVATATGYLPAGTGNAENRTTVDATRALPTPIGTAGTGSTFNGTDNLPTGTGNIRNSTVVDATGNSPAPTGNASPGTAVNGTDDLSEDTITVAAETGVSVTGDVSAGYAASTVDPDSGLAGYGQENSERLPRGPTSTPRYYPKYF